MKALLLSLLVTLPFLSGAVPFEPLIKAAPAGKTDLFEKSVPCSPFVMLGNGKLAEPSTTVKAAYDTENLYFQYTMKDYQPMESFELFLAGENKNPENYIQFYFAEKLVCNRKTTPDPELATKIKYEFRNVGKDRVAMVTIPRNLFPNNTNTCFFRVNFNRSILASTVKFSCWSNTKNGFHVPAKFGWMILGSETEFSKVFYLTEIRKVDVLIREENAKTPGYLDKAKFLELEQKLKTFQQTSSLAEGDSLLQQYETLLDDTLTKMISGAFQNRTGR